MYVTFPAPPPPPPPVPPPRPCRPVLPPPSPQELNFDLWYLAFFRHVGQEKVQEIFARNALFFDNDPVALNWYLYQ